MSVLTIGDSERKKIAELRAVAAANPFDIRGIMRAATQDIEGYRDMMKTHTITLPVGFIVTYSHEVQPEARLCHHISISVDRAGKMPSIDAVNVILAEFGLPSVQNVDSFWVENITPVDKAVNVLQRIPA